MLVLNGLSSFDFLFFIFVNFALKRNEDDIDNLINIKHGVRTKVYITAIGCTRIQMDNDGPVIKLIHK